MLCSSTGDPMIFWYTHIVYNIQYFIYIDSIFYIFVMYFAALCKTTSRVGKSGLSNEAVVGNTST